jgi:signal transduction histidine kinase
MDVLFDYDPSGNLGPDARARESADQLLACYQQALGHELPNLLVSVQGLARLLAAEQGSRLDQDARALLNRLAELARRADSVARATAAVGRTCRDTTPPMAVSLTEAVREALAEVNLLSISNKIEYDVADGMPVLVISRPALHQVLVQLLGNAARAGIPGQALRVTVTARRTPGGSELRIADNGRGMPAELARSAGQPFAAGSGAGPGLGLFLVRQLVARWGGALRVTSEPAVGTAVTILFREPISPESPSALEARLL